MTVTSVKTQKRKPVTYAKLKRSRKHKAILEVKLQDFLGNEENYLIPVMINPKLNTFTCINTRRKNKYTSINLPNNAVWEIVDMNSHNISMRKLYNQDIVLSNGTKRLTGKVLQVNLRDGGGTTTPPPSSLPPIDE